MKGPMPTRTGDVLVLERIRQSLWLVGSIVKDEQQELASPFENFISRADAERKARVIVPFGGRIFVRFETEDWDEIAR